ncbi:MAG: MlaD family protein [Verrucomicrobiota bacterium]
MKSKVQNRTDIIISLVVVACSAFLLCALAVPLLGWNFASQKTVVVELPTATGLRPNSEIRYAGAPVGKILEVKAIPWEERTREGYAVRVVATIDDDTPEIKKDSLAAISSDTLLAEKFIDISPGSAAAENLPEGQPIYSKAVASFDDLTREGMVTLETMNEILVTLKAEHPDLPGKLSSLITTAGGLADKADSLVISISKVLENNEANLNQTTKDLYVVMQNLKVVSTYSKALTATLGRKPWRVVWGTDPNELPTEEEILQATKPIKIEVPKD